MKTLFALLIFFLVIGLFVRKFDIKTSLLLLTFIIGVMLYVTVK